MRRVPNLPPPEFIARDRWYTLLPKRSVGKVVALLILLAGVICFRRRAGSLVKFVGNTPIAGPAARPGSTARPFRANGAAANSVPSSPP
jgi:hypothetical protein